MGAECSVYKDYDLEEPLETSSSDWVLYPAQSRGEGPSTRVSVFVHKKSKKERKQKGGGQKFSQILKVLRHPAILKYYSSHNGSDEVAMVTEPVEPLEHVLNDLAVDEIVAGIYNIVQALVFLHDNGGLSHNSVGLSSVYVSVYDGAWKLGGMQCVSKFTEVTNEFLETAKPLRDSKSITPEEKDGKISLVPEVYHSLDAYAFGMFVCDVLESRPDLIGSESDRFSALMQNSFLHNTPKMRPKLCTLLDNEFFKNDYLDVLSFLNNITVKTDIDKEKFFCSLAVKLKGIPADVVAKRLLPRLLNRFVLAEPSAEKEFLPHILSPCDGETGSEDDGIQPILPLNLFKEHCVPILSKLWTIKDLHVRMILLRFFPFFVGAYDTEALETFIMPQMLIGLRDTDDSLVSATFHALAALVPLLGGEVVVGGQRQKYFTEGRPKFSMGVSPVTKNNTHIHKSSDQKQTKAIAPLNVLDALHMHPKPNLKEEKPPQKITSEEQKQKERNRQKHREEMERKREKLQKERELKKAKREKERDENEKARKTLLELAKEQALEIVVPEHEVISKEDELDDDFEDWDEFETAEPEPEPEPSVKQKLKTSPTRFQTSSSQKFDLTDVDFAPLQNNSARNEPDLIAWNNDDRSPKSDSQKPDREILVKPFGTGRGMKLSTKKPSLRSAKPKPPEGGDLGKMFEIPDITIKPQEPDFFSDMQPELEFKRYDGGVGGANVSTGYSTMMSVQNTAQPFLDENRHFQEPLSLYEMRERENSSAFKYRHIPHIQGNTNQLLILCSIWGGLLLPHIFQRIIR